MLCNTDQQGYNIRSKSTPQKDKSSPQKYKHDVPAVQTGRKNPKRKQVHPSMEVSSSEVDKFASPFSLEHEISKMKIPIPLTELVKNNSYRSHILKWLQPSSIVNLVTNVINLQDENPIIILGPIVEERDDSTPPFYVSLNVHEKIPYNFMLDSGASHNLIPKVFMEEMGF
jgi:hypothetical protein